LKILSPRAIKTAVYHTHSSLPQFLAQTDGHLHYNQSEITKNNLETKGFFLFFARKGIK
jgi:hypothetical protein